MILNQIVKYIIINKFNYDFDKNQMNMKLKF